MENNRPTEEQIMLQRRKKAFMARQEKKKEKKRKIRKFLIFIIVFLLVFIFYDKGFDLSKFKFDFKKIDFKFNFDFLKSKDSKKSGKEGYINSLDGKFIAYIPMDDRDIHTTRIIYLAESGGYDIKMPDAKFYKTNIDKGENSYAGYSTKYGNPLKLATWLLEQEENGCDYYIISLDQLFSGGIAGSEYLDDEDFDVYGDNTIKETKKVFSKIIKNKDNHVYLVDSVVGLNVIPGFLDFTENDYQLLSQYTNIERTELTSDNLTVDNISENYILSKEGTSIPTELNLEKLNRYLSARERKLNLYKYVLKAISKSDNKNNIHLYYGIDGVSNTSKNIQNNDILFLRKIIEEYKINAPIRFGLSTLSEFVFSDLLMDTSSDNIQVKVSYFGNKDKIINGTEVSYSDFMDSLLKDLNISKTDSNPAFEVLVYAGVDDPTIMEAKSNELLTHYLSNIKKHVPTVIVNDAILSNDKYLINNLIDFDKTSIPMGYLIGYSNWNGYINSSRIGVTEGITRYLYLNGKTKKDKLDKGFLKVMGESFYEDIAYIPTDKSSNDLRKIEDGMEPVYKKIANNLSNSNYISNIRSYEEKGIKAIDTYNYSLPWGRINEISFDVTVSVGEVYSITIPESVVYKTETKK